MSRGGATRVRQREYQAVDGTRWTALPRAPGASNLMVVFLHPDRSTTVRDRYAWWITDGPEAHDVTARLDGRAVLAALAPAQLDGLFLRSMPIASDVPRVEPG